MRLATFEHDNRVSIGALTEDGDVVDFAADPQLPADMVDFVAQGEDALGRAKALLDKGEAAPSSKVRLLAPIRPRNNVMCVGKNYVEHAREVADTGFDAMQKDAVPAHPVVFTKALSSLIGPGEPIHISADVTRSTDYEGELALVVGRGGTRISAVDAWDHVYGYTIMNDVTIRELQKKHIQFFIGKSAATYGPIGPHIVTADEIGDVTSLWVRTKVNGEERQAAPVSDLVFSIPTLIEAISAAVLLQPGDVIATGTPAGVGIGSDPPKYLSPGDVVEVSVNGIGTLVSPSV